jgi:glycerol-3-phosphate dehydrogenase
LNAGFAPRRDRLAALASEVFDVAIVGGGITGAAVARDAAARGLTVALVEQEDWAAGTSWRSTKLVHGGLRYLETGEVHLVFESLAERDLLFAAAPHLVRPAEFLLPSFRNRGRPAWQVALGLTAYDLLALGHAPSRHRRLSRPQVLARERLLEGPDLASGAVYPDGRTDDARLTLENVLDAALLGAVAVTRLEVVGLSPERVGSACGLEVRDRDDGRALSVRARCVVNAAGPWGDRVRRLEDPSCPEMLRLSRGVHVAVPARRLPLAGIVAFPLSDGRLLFAIPDGPVTLIGTTDTDFSGSPDAVFAERGDLDYLLAAARQTFPSAGLTVSDVMATFAALRPLVFRPGRTVGKTSREEAVVESDGGLVTVTGGKLTTHRRMAEHAVDRIAARLRREGRSAGPCATKGRPFPGAAGGFSMAACVAAVTSANPDLPEETAAHLAGRYGVRSAEVAGLTLQDRALSRPIVPGLPDIDAEVVFAARQEDAGSLADVFSRRTHLFWQAPGQAMDAVERAAALVGSELGWSRERQRSACDGYAREIALSRACLTSP